MSYTIITACTGCAVCVKICPVAAISGEKKQLHRIDPATCIDCGACGRICPYQAILDQASALCQMVKRSLWLKPQVLEAQCISCGLCLEACPTSVLEMVDLPNTLRPDLADQSRLVARLKDAPNCIGCSFCQATCPVGAIEMQEGPQG